LELFFSNLNQAIELNVSLTALDIGGNHLGDFSPHPANNHKVDYLNTLAVSLKKSRITHLDLSGNSI